jgi:GNAT superfamily N-acetyltransferase
MKTIRLRPAEPDRDFKQLAAWFTLLENEENTETSLQEWYTNHHARILQTVAEDEHGDLLGFYWATRNKLDPQLYTFELYVEPERRRQGTGRRLYDDLAHAIETVRAKKLQVRVKDTCPECRAFTERRGFTELRHGIAMALDLAAFDDRPYEEIIARLEGEGFLFTSMDALGNTAAAQRKLYELNETTNRQTLGTDGEPAWDSFEDFQKRVCQSDWYKPGGQKIAIDSATGVWAAMSAITFLEAKGYAYNLFTGVDQRYRGRKLGQAVKATALRYAREVLNAASVHTDHNSQNLPMIAIDHKMGYALLPGSYLMEKRIIP